MCQVCGASHWLCACHTSSIVTKVRMDSDIRFTTDIADDGLMADAFLHTHSSTFFALCDLSQQKRAANTGPRDNRRFLRTGANTVQIREIASTGSRQTPCYRCVT